MWEWVNQLELERGVATVSEGHCPDCGGRLTQQIPFREMIADNTLSDLLTDPTIFARGVCVPCRLLLRAGHGGSDGRDWLSITGVGGGAVTTLTLNPPDEEHDTWDEDE